MIYGARDSERLLTSCFTEQYGSVTGGVKLAEFLQILAGVRLPFDLEAQMRRQDHPGFPGFECGLPSKFYYFVPNSGYGGHNPIPADALHPSFVYAVDGIGLNFGCPLRLKRALEVLQSLKMEDQIEARHGLAVSSKHLATVEELISAGMFETPHSICRPHEE
jgi:hypothetical protein